MPSLSPVRGAQTLMNGLAVIRSVAEGASDTSGIAQSLDLPKSTVHRLVQALKQEGYLRGSSQGLSLGSTLIELGFRSLAANPLAGVARPFLVELATQTEDTIHLGVEDHERVLYLDKIPGRRGAEMRSRVGLRMPLTRTGVGKVLLLDSGDRWERLWRSDTQEARLSPDPNELADFLLKMRHYHAAGYGFDLEENEPGVRCVAAPIRDAEEHIIGGISVAATAPYMSRERMKELVPLVQQTAHRISVEMGFRPAGPGHPVPQRRAGRTSQTC